ncbi:MAG: DoxX family protein, partial [Crocinitomicaceae bacterium]
MKAARITHWIFTALLSALLLMSAGMYFFNYDEISLVFVSLGFPTWIIYPLGIAKVLGVLMILTKFKGWLTEWAYAGILF